MRASRYLVGGGTFALFAAAPLVSAVLLAPSNSRIVVLAALVSGAIAISGALALVVLANQAIESVRHYVIAIIEGDAEPVRGIGRFPRLRGVSHALAEMAFQLRSRIDELSRLSGEQDAILRSMTEGVVTIDSEGRVRRVNEAARTLLGIRSANVETRMFSEVVEHPDLRAFITNSAAAAVPQMGTVVLRRDPEVVIDIYGSPLFQDDGSSSGTLIVLRDMTRLHKLENVRRDFVANVSHELRTPITSIKGFTETLLEGAMNEPEALKKFLEIIAKHAERLHAIFNDLLTLAKLEAGSEDVQMQFAPHSLAELVREAVESCSASAKEKEISLVAEIAKDFKVLVNGSLVQQAFFNLIDNAIKYSDPGASVRVSVEIHGELIRCLVSDDGPGIESSHLPRLFERFYRVDQGRSRRMGGTGLGLSIVKHISQIHGGRVEVQSVLGKGSTFSFYVRNRQS